MKMIKYAAFASLLFAVSASASEQTATFDTIDVNGETISLATTSHSENGRVVTCQQYLESIHIGEGAAATSVSIGSFCSG